MKILVISPTPTHPQNAGNRARIFNLLHAIKDMGHEVFFMHVQTEQGDTGAMRRHWQDRFVSLPYQYPLASQPLSHKLRRRFISMVTSHPNFHFIDDLYDTRIDHAIRTLHEKEHFDVVLVEYVFFSKALENFGTDVIKIIDTHDIFTDRYRIYEKAGMKPQWFSTAAKEEQKGLNRAAIILAIQEKDKHFFQTLCARQIITIGYLAPLMRSLRTRNDNKRILFIGSDNPINIEAVDYFLQSVFPAIRSAVPETELCLAGKVANSFPHIPGCMPIGEFDALDDAYSLSDIVINPARIGTGLSIKAIEAMGYSKALVSTRTGIRGIEDGEGNAFLVADSPELFAQYVIRLLDDREFLRNLTEGAYTYARNWNDRNLKELMNLFYKNGEHHDS
ncbi:MAG TPA: glycosyltransferase family 4 protein [Deltaproteobacteria bacterium]|nr:glycosyltransferase family 4 protein [Deltaproteobacteria bacterium]